MDELTQATREDTTENTIINNETLTDETTNENISEESTEDIPAPNCLALTVKKEYSLPTFVNFIVKSARVSLKVALSTIILHILDLFL